MCFPTLYLLKPFLNFCDTKLYIKVPKIPAVVFHPLTYYLNL